jgi:hypothetical protein
MVTGRMRPLLAATVIVATMAYGLSGHGLSQMSAHDGMAGAAASLCLLLATALAYTAIPKPMVQHRAVATEATSRYIGPPHRPPLDGRARASPSALQCFRN